MNKLVGYQSFGKEKFVPARDLHGMPHSSGTAVLLTVEGLNNLVTFFQKTTYHGRSMPFEIKGVSINVACMNEH